MPEVSADQSKNLKITFRKGEGRSILVNVVDSNDNPYDLTSFEFIFEVFNVFDRSTNIFQLTQNSGGGIVNGGLSGVVELTPDNDQVDFEEGAYEYRFRTTEPNTWFNAPFIINNTPLPEEITDSTSVILDLGDININVTLALGTNTGSGGEGGFRGFWDATGGLFPSDPSLGDDWDIEEDKGGVLKNRDESPVFVPPFASIKFRGGDPALGASWRIFF